MKKIILIYFLLPCLVFSQQYKDFYYEKIAVIDGFIGKIETYDSKTGIYFKESCHMYAPPFNEKVLIPITEKEKIDLWKLRKEFGNFVFGEFTFNKNVTLTSNFYFENEKYPPKHIETDIQKKRFIKLDITLKKILESKPEYRKTFYWEFIKK